MTDAPFARCDDRAFAEVPRRCSVAAACCAVCGGLALLAFAFPTMAVTGILGAPAGWIGLRSIRRYELAGRRFAVGGIVCSFVIPLLAACWHVGWFWSEAPAGHARLDFAEMMRSADSSDSPPLQRHVGRAVCLKGHIPVTEFMHRSERFAFSPDGDEHKPETCVIVEASAPVIEWPAVPLAISGILEPTGATDAGTPRFRLTNVTIRQASTPFQLISRVPGRDC